MNSLLIANFSKLSFRKAKADKKDAMTIARFLMDHHEEASQEKPAFCVVTKG